MWYISSDKRVGNPLDMCWTRLPASKELLPAVPELPDSLSSAVEGTEGLY